MVLRRFPARAVAVLALAAMVWPGCDCGGEDTTATSSGTTTSGDGGGGVGGEGGGTTTSTSSGGGGGAGGEGGGAAESGRSASQMVSAGEVASSPGYRMVFTFGQPTQNQGRTTSPSYRMQGGLVGANGSLP